VKYEVTVPGTVTIAPDGTNTGQLVVPTVDDTQHSIQEAVNIGVGTGYVFSIFAKAGGYSSIGLSGIYHPSGLTPIVEFDLAAGSITYSQGCTAAIKAVGNGWYRCSMVATHFFNAGSNSLGIYVGSYFNGYSGNGSSGVYLWGAQVEASLYLSDYVKTTGTAITTYANTAADTDKIRIGTNIAGQRVSGDLLERLSFRNNKLIGDTATMLDAFSFGDNLLYTLLNRESDTVSIGGNIVGSINLLSFNEQLDNAPGSWRDFTSQYYGGELTITPNTTSAPVGYSSMQQLSSLYGTATVIAWNGPGDLYNLPLVNLAQPGLAPALASRPGTAYTLEVLLQSNSSTANMYYMLFVMYWHTPITGSEYIEATMFIDFITNPNSLTPAVNTNLPAYAGVLATLTSTVTVVGGGWRKYTVTVVTPASMPTNWEHDVQILVEGDYDAGINMAGLQMRQGRPDGNYVANAGLWTPDNPLEKLKITALKTTSDTGTVTDRDFLLINKPSRDSLTAGLVPINVWPAPLDIYSFVNNAFGNACFLARDTTQPLSPAAGIPMKMTVAGSDPYTNTYAAPQWNLADAAAGQTWRASVWVRGSVATTGQLFIFGINNPGSGLLDFGAGGVSISQSSWTQVSFTFTFSNPAVQKIQVRLDGPDAGPAGVIIWWDGLRVERQHQRGFGDDIVESINLLSFNEQLDNAPGSWFDSGPSFYGDEVTVTPNTTSAPVGYSSMQQLSGEIGLCYLIAFDGDEGGIQPVSLSQPGFRPALTSRPNTAYTLEVLLQPTSSSAVLADFLIGMFWQTPGTGVDYQEALLDVDASAGVISQMYSNTTLFGAQSVYTQRMTSTVTVVGGGWRKYTITAVTPANQPANMTFSIQIYPYTGAPSFSVNMAGLQVRMGRPDGNYVANAGLWTPANSRERVSFNMQLRPLLETAPGIKGPTDINIVSNQGSIRNTNYVDINYIAEDYVGDSRVITY
jgi:hypothetical protein